MRMRKGKEIDEGWLASQLAPYGIRPRTVRIESTTAKGYMQEGFSEVFRRYIPRSEVDALQMEDAPKSGEVGKRDGVGADTTVPPVSALCS